MTEKAAASLRGDAERQAKYRTFQNDGGTANVINWLRNQLNKAAIKDKKGGSLGAGDLLMVFAKVPANIAGQKLENTPLGWAKALAELAVARAQAKRGDLDPKYQAKVSRDCGRMLGSIGLTTLGAALSALGAIGNTDGEDDEDKKALLKDKGIDGLYINLSAFLRGLIGEGRGYRSGDIVMDGDWMEILSLPISLGAMIQQAAEDDTPAALLPAVALGYTFGNLKETLGNLPGMSAFESLFNGAQYADVETGNAAADMGLGIIGAAESWAASTAAGFVAPNGLTQFSAGLDNTVRDVYNTDSSLETALNILLEKSGVFRGLISPQFDSFGNEKRYGDGRLMGILNRALLPGAIRRGEKSEVEDELARLSEAGYKNLYPKKNPPSSIKIGGKSYELTANGERTYNEVYGQTLEKAYSEFISSGAYDRLSDSQRAEVMAELKSSAANEAKQRCMDKAGIEGQASRDAWETALSGKSAIDYLAAKAVAKELFEGGKPVDFDGLDEFLAGYGSIYGSLNAKARELLSSSYTRLDNMFEAGMHGIDSQTYDRAYRLYQFYSKANGGQTDNAEDLKTALFSLKGINEAQAEWLANDLRIWKSIPVDTESYDKLTAGGVSHENANAVMDAFRTLQPAEGYKTIQAAQKFHAISETPGLNDSEKWKAFFAIATEKDLDEGEKYWRWGYSYDRFVFYCKRCDIKTK